MGHTTCRLSQGRHAEFAPLDRHRGGDADPGRSLGKLDDLMSPLEVQSDRLGDAKDGEVARKGACLVACFFGFG